jgi:membrane fusion protein, heavy metal efflux system
MKNTKILLLTVTLFFVACSQKKLETEDSKPFRLSDKMLEGLAVDSVIVAPLINEISLYGKITTDNNKLIEIFPVVGGNVSEVYVELGDYVNKGQLLATIRSTEVAAFEKELEDAKNDVIVAENNLRVTQELFESRLNTEKDVIESQSQVEKAKSQLERIKATYKIYDMKKGAIYEIRSPLSGFIIQKNINKGMLLRSDRTDNIFDIAEISEVWAIANVNESDIYKIQLGYDAYVSTLSYPDKKFHGKVDKIFNIIDPESKAMKVRIKLKNESYHLKPEMRAQIKLHWQEPSQMLMIPNKALVFDKSKYFVMVYKDTTQIETRQVELFRQVGEMAFIKSGLNQGEKVITHQQLLIYDALND